jgi:hypothetical protein
MMRFADLISSEEVEETRGTLFKAAEHADRKLLECV